MRLKTDEDGLAVLPTNMGAGALSLAGIFLLRNAAEHKNNAAHECIRTSTSKPTRQ
ncbi:MAG: hypothetical protein K2P61_03190 [Burkholderiaceae bacterium]|nr:hypothetical protein [Burkholderiaceae bacterium]